MTKKKPKEPSLSEPLLATTAQKLERTFSGFAVTVMVVAQQIWHIRGRGLWWRIRNATSDESEALTWAAKVGFLEEKCFKGRPYYRAGKYEPRLCYGGKKRAYFDGLITGMGLALYPCTCVSQGGTRWVMSSSQMALIKSPSTSISCCLVLRGVVSNSQ